MSQVPPSSHAWFSTITISSTPLALACSETDIWSQSEVAPHV